MAVASLVMSFLAFLVPVGIAAIAFGHISRSEIAKSNGRQKGTALAFTALILAYLQVIAVSLIIIPVIIGMWRLAHSVGGGPNESTIRAALVGTMLSGGDPDKEPDAREAEVLQEHLVAALQVIRYREHEYASRNDNRYGCALEIGLQTGEIELRQRLARYDIRCGLREGAYIVTAVPRTYGPLAARLPLPDYCVDSSETIWRYPVKHSFDPSWHIYGCPTDGERVE